MVKKAQEQEKPIVVAGCVPQGELEKGGEKATTKISLKKPFTFKMTTRIQHLLCDFVYFLSLGLILNKLNYIKINK